MKNPIINGVQGFALLVLLTQLGACGISSEGLVPEQTTKPTRRIERSVRVMPVVGGHASKFGGEAYITNEQYFGALRKTVADSGMFSRVVDSDPVDLNLHSEIITISTERGMSPVYAIVVQYWLVDSASGKEIWRKGINTRHKVEWNEAFAGGTRIIMAVEGATQKNLTQLIEALAASNLP